MSDGFLLRADDLTKRFGPLSALDRVDLQVTAGEIHGVLGENGAGKTTLMNLLYGILRPDTGRILWRGREVRPRSPRDGRALGIGMVHQHFTLVGPLPVWENVWLGHPGRPALRLGRSAGRRAVRELSERFRLDLDPEARVEDLPIGIRQRVEIAKALVRRCALLILDEPTAVLAPAQIRDLFRVLRRLAGEGTAVLFISHKLGEVLEISDRITVLRRGKVVMRRRRAEALPGELTRAILGVEGSPPSSSRPPTRPRPDRPRPAAGSPPLLSARGLRSEGASVPLRDVTFEVRSGEILGVTGVDGNGQDELVTLLAGLVRPGKGSILLGGEDVTRLGVRERWRRGLSVLPGDRGRDGLLLEASLWENLALREFGARWARRGGGLWVDPEIHVARARELLERHNIRGAGPGGRAGSLSGGNQQKLLLARELAADPAVLVLLNPTRGLDVGAASALLRLLGELRDRGRAVLLFSTELDEIVSTADRWAVMHAGRWREASRPDPEILGAMMLGAGPS